MNSGSPAQMMSFTRVLACAAMSPSACGILVLEASPRDVISIASAFQQMLEITSGQELSPVVQLGVNESEDDLWGLLSLDTRDTTELRPWHRPGILTGLLQQDRPGLVIIPDLTQSSIAAKRALVTSLGAPELYFERHGLHGAHSNNIYWLAGCSEETISSMSHHLLDRFLYRAVKPREFTHDRATDLSNKLGSLNSAETKTLTLSPLLAESLNMILPGVKNAKGSIPSYSASAINRVLDIFPGPEDFHIRRQVSLCRLARSIAQLNRKTQVTVGDVDEAASIMGLQTTSTQPLGIPDESPHDPTSGQTTPPLNTLRLVADKEFEAESSKDSEFLSSQQWQNVALSPITSSYPEDNVLPQREFADLRYPLTRRSKQHQDTGVVIGTEKTTGLRDLSITDTIFESAKYCQIRRRNKPQLGDSLSITPADLRKHRRSAKPDHMLILLLDHTCLGDIKKHESRISDAIEDALVAHLRWAYFERASVTIIEVGSGNAGNELRAEKVTAATLVDRRIATALEFNPGKATPLAHGLSLAYETLRRSLWQGRSQPQRVRLVVLSDGRGNVPLSASLTGEIAPPVHAAGITDSFEQARKIRHFSQSESLNRVEAYFLTPSSQISFKQNLARKYSAQDLSVRMAREMNAQFSMISPN